MSQHAYRLVNVFTRNGEALSGNPLCVFEDGTPFDTATMQRKRLHRRRVEHGSVLEHAQRISAQGLAVAGEDIDEPISMLRHGRSILSQTLGAQ